MKATLVEVRKETSHKWGKVFYYFFFKGADGHSYRSCVGPAFRNFRRWKYVLDNSEKIIKEGIIISNLKVKAGFRNLFDADSLITLERIPVNA